MNHLFKNLRNYKQLIKNFIKTMIQLNLHQIDFKCNQIKIILKKNFNFVYFIFIKSKKNSIFNLK